MYTLRGFDSTKEDILDRLKAEGVPITLSFKVDGMFQVQKNPFEKAGFSSDKIKSADGSVQIISVSK